MQRVVETRYISGNGKNNGKVIAELVSPGGRGKAEVPVDIMASDATMHQRAADALYRQLSNGTLWYHGTSWYEKAYGETRKGRVYIYRSIDS